MQGTLSQVRQEISTLVVAKLPPGTDTKLNQPSQFFLELKNVLLDNVAVLQDLFWDLIPSLLSALDDHIVPGEFEEIQDLGFQIALNCPPKEVLLVLEDCFFSVILLPSTNASPDTLCMRKIFALNILKKVLLQLGRRGACMDRIVEIVLRIVRGMHSNTSEQDKEEEDEEREEGESKEGTASVHILPDKAPLVSTSEVGRVLPVVISVVSAIVEDISNKLNAVAVHGDSANEGQGVEGEHANKREVLDLELQRKYVLSLLFSLLGDPLIISCRLNLGPSQLVLCLIVLSVSCKTILDSRDSQKEADEDNEINNELNAESWSYAGIGHYLHCVTQPVVAPDPSYSTPALLGQLSRLDKHYPRVLAPSYAFDKTLVYIPELLKHDNSGTKSLPLVLSLVKTIPQASHMILPLNPQYHWGISELSEHNLHLEFFQELLSWTVRCPNITSRTKAHTLFQTALSCFTASSRFAMLVALIPSPFPAVSALFIHRIKQEIDFAYHEDRYGDNSPAFFASSKVLEILPLFMHAGGSILERMDEIIAGLNLYRYILLKDKNYNKTSIWSHSQISAVRQQFIDPLRSRATELLKQFNTPKTSKEHEKQAKILGLPQLSETEYQQAADMATTNILLMIDLVARVEEIQGEIE